MRYFVKLNATSADFIHIPHHSAATNTSADIIPVIMAGIIGIYGLVVSVLISGDRTFEPAHVCCGTEREV